CSFGPGHPASSVGDPPAGRLPVPPDVGRPSLSVPQWRSLGMALLQSRGPVPTASSQEAPRALPPERGGVACFLLGLTVAPAFCSGLFALSLLPSLGVAVPRWLMLACGFGCALMALVAPHLSRCGRPRASGQQEHGSPTDEGRAPLL